MKKYTRREAMALGVIGFSSLATPAAAGIAEDMILHFGNKPPGDPIAFWKLSGGLLDKIGSIPTQYSTPAITGTTIYVDASRADDSGNGLTRATAKKTIAGAYAVASTGNTILLIAGSYSPAGIGWAKSLRLVGESKSECIINAPGSGNCFNLQNGSTGSIFESFTIGGTGASGSFIFANSYVDAITVRDFFVSETVVSRIISQSVNTFTVSNFIAKGGGGFFVNGGTLNIMFAEMYEFGDGQTATINNITAGTTNINNCVIIGGRPSDATLRCSGGTLTANNCIIGAPGESIIYKYVAKQEGAGTLTINNSIVLGSANKAHIRYYGTVTLNDCQENTYPDFVTNGKNLGMVSLFAVDSNVLNANIDPLQDGADRAGAHVSIFIDDHDHLTTEQETRLREFVAAGHDLGVEGNSSSSLDQEYPCYVQYTGADTGCTLTIANGFCTITTTEGNDDLGPFSTDREELTGVLGGLGGLVATIDASGVYASALITENASFDDAYTDCLADGVYDLSGGGQVNLAWDMDKWLTEEVTVAKSNVETIIGGEWECASYFYARYTYSEAAKAYIKAAGYTSAWYGQAKVIDLNNTGDIFAMSHEYMRGFSNLRGSGYDALDAAGKEARIRGAAAAMAVFVMRYGLWESVLITTPDLSITEDEVYWFCDELISAGVMVVSFAEAVDYITTRGTATGDSYNLGLADTYTAAIKQDSPALGTGLKTVLNGASDIYDAAGIKIYDGGTGLPDCHWLDGVDIGSTSFGGAGKYFMSLLGIDGAYYWPSAPEIIARTGIDNAVYDSDGVGKTFASTALALAAMTTLADDTYLFCGPKGVALYDVDMSAKADKINRYLGN